jgi:paraquat-inducible protein B
MANEQNLIPQAHKLTVEEASKGGQKSAQVRREKKTVQKILNDFLSTAAKDNPQVSKLAAKMGLQDDGSIKDLFTIVCTLNTLKDGNLSDLERLSKLLGEQTEVADTEAEKQAAFLDAVKKAVTDAD